jgi:hypothetical protein
MEAETFVRAKAERVYEGRPASMREGMGTTEISAKERAMKAEGQHV